MSKEDELKLSSFADAPQVETGGSLPETKPLANAAPSAIPGRDTDVGSFSSDVFAICWSVTWSFPTVKLVAEGFAPY
jgi:hypothetical protein